jgi:hypothetical protein
MIAVSNAANDFLSLARENYAKLIPEVILEVNDSSIGIDMFRSFDASAIWIFE